MQTTKRATGVRTADPHYQTIVQQAINKVTGFQQLYKELERAINVSGKSKSTLTNYSRQLAHLALHYQQLPTELDNEQGFLTCVLRYLRLLSDQVTGEKVCFGFGFFLLKIALPKLLYCSY